MAMNLYAVVGEIRLMSYRNAHSHRSSPSRLRIDARGEGS